MAVALSERRLGILGVESAEGEGGDGRGRHDRGAGSATGGLARLESEESDGR